MPSLTQHPRLYINDTNIARLKQEPSLDILQNARDAVARQAERAVKSPHFEWSTTGHNAHLLRARRMQGRVVDLLTQWEITGKDKYRLAAFDHLVAMGEWEYWSWIAWRKHDPDPLAVYDLSYGENSTTLAIGYSWLHSTLSDAQRRKLIDIARERSFKSFLKYVSGKEPASWYKRPDSNWNTVCTGGAGMLALAMYEDLPEARKALPYAEKSIKPFMDELKRTQGGWVEGLGYWNYGMRYAFMFLLSHQRATGKKNPLLHSAATRKTLAWPLLMTPHGQAAAFGDINRWNPLPFHVAAAEATGQVELIAPLTTQFSKRLFGDQLWPDAAELLLLHPGSVPKSQKAKTQRNYTELTKGLDWAVLADQMPEPRLYTSIRGGNSHVPHGHRDLSSFHVVSDGERLIESLNSRTYLDTTFSSRRYELFETSYRSKNVVLIDGVGITGGVAPIAPIKAGALNGYRVEMTDCMGKDREGPVCKFYGRAFFMLPDAAAVVVVDELDVNHPAQLDSQLYTFGDLKVGAKQSARIKGDKAQLSIACASNVEAQLFTAVPPTTLPPVTKAARQGEQSAEKLQPKLLRYCSLDLERKATIVTVIARGRYRPTVNLDASSKIIAIDVEGRHSDGKAYRHAIRLTRRLKPAK